MALELKDGIEGLTSFIALHRNQLESSGVPEHFWETLYNKLKHGIFDAGQSFALAQIEDEEEELDFFARWKALVVDPEGINLEDSKHIYLIDHAWTFRPSQARTHLESIAGLLDRMSDLVGVDNDSSNIEGTIENVLKEIWKYSQSYSIGNPTLEAEERVPIWYVLDEFGSRIQHSNDPNVRLVPFFYLTEGATYSLLFPCKNLEKDDEITRNFVEGFTGSEAYESALVYPWCKEFEEKYLPSTSLEQTEPGPEYFASNRMNETLPADELAVPELPKDRKIRAYVEYSFIRDFLKHPRFEVVDDIDNADVLWLSSHFKDFRKLSLESPQKRINQFPCEHLLTVKDLLCIIARRSKTNKGLDMETLQTEPSWLPTTFNLKTELPNFIALYKARESRELGNYWIIKPWNLARSLDTHITNNLDFILRLATSGPKICQKYVERPVLFYRNDISASVKFDVRYIILLSSTEPLKAYAYKRFWLRFANKPFELNRFDEYERHFTVMNYSATTLHQMFCHDFIRLFEEQYPSQRWDVIEGRIFSMLSSLLKGAVQGDARIPPSPQSRAMYAVDLILSWTDNVLDGDSSGPSIQPQLLEVNWAPDCKRACQYYPEFFDDIFSVLFLDEVEGKNVQAL